MGSLALSRVVLPPLLRRTRRLPVVLVATLALFTAGAQAVYALPPALTQVSTDPFSGPSTSQQKTELEPDTFAFGSGTGTAFAGLADASSLCEYLPIAPQRQS